MRATIIADNIKSDELSGEWGLSIYIEYKDKKILLDTGASPLFSENAKKLNIPLKDIDFAVLSHAHYDHSNGMETFFKENDKAKFYLRSGCCENCYKKVWIVHKYIGIRKGTLSGYSDRIVYADGDYKICDGVSLIPHKTYGLDNIGKRENMFLRKGIRWVPDDFSHEQSLVFETENGLVIFNSCSHGGAANIINEVSRTFPGKNVYAIIGGFHLHNKPEAEVREFAKKVKDTGIKHVYTGHCTGSRPYAILKEELGDMANQFRAGLVIEDL